MNNSSHTQIFNHGIFGFLKILLRGASQVMFQRNALTGLLFLVGIFWGAYSTNSPAVGWGALLGVMVSTSTGFILNLRPDEGNDGLWGFNGILVGCAMPTFLGESPAMWISLMLCAALTTWVREGLNNVMRSWKVNSFTFPFVICTWLFLLAAARMHSLDIDPTTPHLGEYTLTLNSLLRAWMRGIGQVFLIDSPATGLIFLIALAISNRWAAIWAAIGSGVALGVAILMGTSPYAAAHGLYSFSAVLTAIALATTFYRPSWRSALWALMGVVITLFSQAAMDSVLSHFGLATLTAPFCLTTWIFLLPLLKFDYHLPDHSEWHRQRAESQENKQ